MTDSRHTILLVDDDEQILISYDLMLRSAGIGNIVAAQDSRNVMPMLSEKDVAVIVLDLIMPHISGSELLSKINQDYPHIPVIVVTANDDLEIAVDCMKHGASDYLVKPVEKNRFMSSIKKVLEFKDLQDEVSYLRHHLLSDYLEYEDAFASMITQNKKMLSIFHYVEAIVKTERPICICGETGVGKELLAHSIYKVSGLRGEYITVNVAGLDDTMFSDTLFGHKKGAYTSADKDRPGLIAQASEGMLLLDEIGDLSESSQLKLLRLLEKNQYYPLGSDIPGKSDVRITASTNKDLKKQISEGKFRKDLYYRLCAHVIHIPPLRARTEDIPLLLDHFTEQASKLLSKKKPAYPSELITLLANYDFPGNVRELQAMVFDAVAQHKSGILSMNSFREFLKQSQGYAELAMLSSVQEGNSIPQGTQRFPTLKEIEDRMISEALKRSNGNQGIAASLLGISRQTLNKRLKKPRTIA